jgi:hypothetical protein
MGLRDSISGLFGRFSRSGKNVSSNYAKKLKPISDIDPAPDFGGARTTIPKFAQGGGGVGMVLSKRVQTDLGLDERRFSQYTIDQLIDIFADAHPDLSFALWNFIRMSNSGYSITCKKLNGNPDPTGEKNLKELLTRFEAPNVLQFEKSRSIDRVINQMIQSVVTRGATACELVLTPKRDDVAFIAPVDPATVDFVYDGQRYKPSQNMRSVDLDIPTFFYEGLDERIDDPYGRSPIMSAIHMVIFQLQILNDLKAVVHNQGYPRLDLKVIEEVLLNRMPISIRNNEQKKQEWLKDRLQEIIDMYSALEPDDAFVHFDSVEIGMAGEAKAMIDPQKLMQVIDNLIMSGLKTLSTILGRRSTGNTESFAKIEIKLYLKGVEAIQQVVETVLSRALTLALNIRGKQAIVNFKFKPLEIRTELEQAQFEQVALLNYAFMRDQGWIDQDEAAMKAVGHAPVMPEPDWAHLQPTKNKDGATPSGTPDTTPSQ